MTWTKSCHLCNQHATSCKATTQLVAIHIAAKETGSSKQSVVVSKYTKSVIMANYADGQGLRELLGDKMYEDYFGETTKLETWKRKAENESRCCYK